MPWLIAFKGKSGFSARNTAEDVIKGIDGHGLTAIIIGPTSGIGLETASVLALRDVHVVMAARNVEAAATKCKETIIKGCPDAAIDVMKLDVSSLESVTNFANEYFSKGLPLNILMGDGFRKMELRVNLQLTILGASATCYLALNPKVKGVSGEYYADNNVAKPSRKGRNAELAKKLWEFGMKLTKSK